MKIGSTGWGWTPTPEDMPHGESLERIADNVKELGFDIIDYLSTWESLDGFFTEAVSRRIGEYCRNIGLEVGGLVFQSGMWNQVNPAEKQKQLDYFKKCAETARALGANTISCIIPGPLGQMPTRRGASPSEKHASNLPDSYSWRKDWENYVSQMQAACDVAASYKLRIALECFMRSLVSTPHAMLKIIEDVERGNFGIQLDTAHLFNQHLDVETAIYMLGADNIFNVHAKDTDGVTRNNLPCGCGLIDYTAVLRALRNVGYKGNVSVEVEFTDNPRRYMKQAIDHLKLCVAGQY